MKSLRLILASSGIVLCALAFAPLQIVSAQSAHQSAPDNSNQNKSQQQTADNQSNAPSDRHITAEVRKAIVADKSLSMYAHNVKIITMNGAVTLKGPVASEDEKQKIASDAASVVSNDKVINNLTVKR
jgi:hyperosmotically inducible protein